MFRLVRYLVLIALIAAPIESVPAENKTAPAKRVTIPLVDTDYPDYMTVVGQLVLKNIDPAVLKQTEPKFLRLSLADIQEEAYLPEGDQIYQTISTDLLLPVNLNFIVDVAGNAVCFNPEVPYCSDFSELNKWLSRAGLSIKDAGSAKALARFVIDMGLSTVHHPRSFQYFRIAQDFPIQWHQFINKIDDIYLPEKAPYRDEQKQQEYTSLTERYGSVVQPVELQQVGEDYRLHGFTYKIMQAAGDLREWTVVVHADGTVDVDMKELATGVGELYWPFAP